jgi:hypothetical protein
MLNIDEDNYTRGFIAPAEFVKSCWSSALVIVAANGQAVENIKEFLCEAKWLYI